MFGWLRKMLPLRAGPANMLAGITRSTIDPPKRGTLGHLEVYEVAPWPRAVGDKVATAVACCDFRLLAVKRGGKTVRNRWAQGASMDERAAWLKRPDSGASEVTEHPFLAALDNPNPYMDRIGLLKTTELHLDFVGDAFWLKERNAIGVPVGFWPLPPHWVTETPRVDNPSFRVSYRSWQATVPASDVQWFHESAPSNPYTRGTGIGWSLADEIQVDEYAAKMAAAFFFNRARPDFVFATGLGEDETRRFEQDWTNRLQGFWRAHRPYFLASNGGDQPDLQKQIREFQQPTMEQLVYPNLRKVQRDIILQVWGVPPEMFGIVENSNRATIEAAEYLFTKWSVAPKGGRMRSGLQRLFIEEYDERGVIHMDSPVTEDKAYRLDTMKAAPWVPTLDEWRLVQGLPPEGNGLGGSRMIPLNSYLTADPLDPTTRPQGGGAAQRAGDAPAGGQPPPKKALTVRQETGLLRRAMRVMRAMASRPVTLQLTQGDVNVQPAQAFFSPTLDAKLVLPELPAPVVHVDNHFKAEMPARLTVDVGSVPITETTVTARDDKGIAKTRTEQA